jgi:nucleoside-diphosphate-sugar epimerase
MKTVGILGGAGFIGSHVTRLFLENNFKVKVSATNINNIAKYQHLQNLVNSHNLLVIACDVQNTEDLETFVSGCDIVVHSGTPFQLDVQDVQAQLFDPTIKGTENFLQVISSTPGIEKVVLVASVAAWNTNFPMPAGGKSATDLFDENDTRFMSTEGHPYAQAKFIANQTVEKFLTGHTGIGIEICTVSPVMVMGNSLSNREDSTSMGLQYLFKHKLAPNDFIQSIYDNDIAFAIVDVEDVAQSIFKAATTPGLHGKDFLLTSESYKVSDLHALLNNRTANNEASIVYKNGLAVKELGMHFKPVKEMISNLTS